jgi:hypothetical protein
VALWPHDCFDDRSDSEDSDAVAVIATGKTNIRDKIEVRSVLPFSCALRYWKKVLNPSMFVAAVTRVEIITVTGTTCVDARPRRQDEEIEDH